MQNRVVAVALVVLSLSVAGASVAQTRPAPDILVLGDSRLSFGAGRAFVAWLEALRGECGLARDATVGVIGVRSSSLQSWTSPGRRARGAICDVDPNWKVNAGAYGLLSPGDAPTVQIGAGVPFQFF